jgi:hypothetical protein
MGWVLHDGPYSGRRSGSSQKTTHRAFAGFPFTTG